MPEPGGALGNIVECGAVGDFTPGQPRIFSHGGREIGVVSWAGKFFAIRNTCPHQFAPLCLGFAADGIEASVDLSEVEFSSEDPVLVCPWHGWEVSLRTGRVVGEPAQRVAVYPVEVVDGQVKLDLGGRRKDLLP